MTDINAAKFNVMQRTSTSTVKFVRPFRLDGVTETLPAGTYLVETDEELLQGVSFPAYRRVATTMQQVLDPPRFNTPVILVADPRQLDLALIQDQATGAQDNAGDVLPADKDRL